MSSLRHRADALVPRSGVHEHRIAGHERALGGPACSRAGTPRSARPRARTGPCCPCHRSGSPKSPRTGRRMSALRSPPAGRRSPASRWRRPGGAGGRRSGWPRGCRRSKASVGSSKNTGGRDVTARRLEAEKRVRWEKSPLGATGHDRADVAGIRLCGLFRPAALRAASPEVGRERHGGEVSRDRLVVEGFLQPSRQARPSEGVVVRGSSSGPRRR